MEQEATGTRGLKVAVVGCTHGELDKMYETIEHMRAHQNIHVDLLLCCGDFQAVRNLQDLNCLACKPNYRRMNTFYKYYSGEKVAPVPTLFIGGNHEASNHLSELFFGGWVAPNIWYMGMSGVVNFGGLRIAGLSGIFKGYDYRKGHFEKVPYSENDLRSIYHVRECEVWKLKQIAKPLDVVMSHDWPRGIVEHGNLQQLLRYKSFLRDEIANNTFGSPGLTELLLKLQPDYWFAGHMHVKFPAVVRHGDTSKMTKFLALDKVVPRRDFLQVLDFPNAVGPKKLSYDEEWLAILRSTHHLIPFSSANVPLPDSSWAPDRWDYRPKEEEIEWIRKRSIEVNNGGLAVPNNFVKSVEVFQPGQSAPAARPTQPNINPQHSAFLEFLCLPDVFHATSAQPNEEEIALDFLDEANEAVPAIANEDVPEGDDQPAQSSANSSFHSNPEEIAIDDLLMS